MLDTRPGTLPSDAPLTDLGPLAWVFEEVRKSLDTVTKAVQRFARDAQQWRHDELSAPDVAPLRMARQQLHQAVGALEMVGLSPAAQFLRAMEAAVQRIAQKPPLGTEAAASTIERAGFALVEYLESVLRNKPVQPVALFAQYRDVQQLAGAERVHPADLWPFERRATDVPAPEQASAWPTDAPLRSLLDRLVLLLLRARSPAAAQQLSRLSAGLSVAATSPRTTTFWRVAAAFFEALAHDRLPADAYAKRAISRVLLQFMRFQNGGELSETLLHDLLFFCAQAGPDPDDHATTDLSVVRQAFGLANAQPVDYTQTTLGRFDPSLLVQVRKRIAVAKASWTQFTGGDASRARQVVDQFALLGEALIKLYPDSTPLAQSLMHAVDQAARVAGAVRPELAMEVATTTLYLEAAFEDFDPGQHALQDRSQALADRLNRVVAGEPSAPLDVWMEQLYRRVSDRQTMGSVVGELKMALAEAEKSLDQFFRTPQDKDGLHVAVAQLAQMRGVLSVLGLDHAVQAVSRMRAQIEEVLDTEVDEARAREAGTFEHLGHNLSALSFMVDMLGYQPTLAKTLFTFDERLGELVPLMGRTVSTTTPVLVNEARAISADVQQVVEGAQTSPDLLQLSGQLAALAERASLAEQDTVAKVAREAAQALERQEVEVGAHALIELAQATAEPVSAPVPLQGAAHADTAEDEPPLRDIFLLEAREVLGHGHAALTRLRASPVDLEQMTTLRRAFHTLKGSARMIGLTPFGEACWAMEQVFNAELADQQPATTGLLDLSRDALDALAQWVEDMAAERDGPWQAQPFHASAQAWREQRRYAPIRSNEAQPSVAAAGAIAVTEAALPMPPGEAPLPPSEQASSEQALQAPWPELLPTDSPTPQLPTEPEEPAEGPAAMTGVYPGHLAPYLAPPATDPAGAEPESGSNPASTASTATEPVAVDAAPTPAAVNPIDTAGWDDPLARTPGEPAVDPTVTVSQPAPAAAAQALMAPASLPRPEDAQQPQEAHPPLPAAEPAAANDTGVDDEQTKVIGPLRIALKLYNVFLNEADVWSRRLCTVLDEWVLSPDDAVPEDAEDLAHALAGASAAVGFQSLSDLARALEHAIGAIGRQQQVGPVGDAGAAAQLFAQAAEDIRRLLHQLAAGFYQEPRAPLLAALNGWVHASTPPTPAGAATDHAPDLPAPAPEGMDTASAGDAPSPATPPAPAADPALAAPQATTSTVTAPAVAAVAAVAAFNDLLPQDADAAAPGQALPVQDIDDDIDAVDTIDADLFPIFADEAQELLPQLGSALRQWAAQPDHGSARAEVLRSLHTLKGSARLAGALRLGEMTHRLETDAERLGTERLRSGDIEPLLAAFDAIAARFDGLRQADPAVPATVQTAPEEGPPVADGTPAPQPALSASEVSTEVPVEQEAAAAIAATALVDGQDTAAVSVAHPAVPGGLDLPPAPVPAAVRAGAAVRVRPELLDRMVNQTGEVMISRSRMETELVNLRGSLRDLTSNLDRLRQQLRDLELQAETQMQSRLAQAREAEQSFDPLEFDRYTRVQEVTRMMAESVNDVATVQRNLQRAVESTEDGLAAQARQTRELQRDLLRTRMVEFEGIAERLYRVVRQASKETGKQVRLDITGGQIEMDRGVLDRMTAAFEHLLRNSVVHGIEPPAVRQALGKPAEGRIDIRLSQEINDVSVSFEDDGAGLDLSRLREKAQALGLIEPGQMLTDEEAAQLIFLPGLSTASEVSSLAGRGVGMDVVRNDVLALGGRIETDARPGQGARFRLVLPLTTAVTQVVMIRAGVLTVGVPSNLVEIVRRVTGPELAQAYAQGHLSVAGEAVPFYWAGALLQSSAQSQQQPGRTLPVVVFRSAAQRVALHVDEVLGNQEVVVKNLGPQLSRLPGLAGMSVLASGAVVLIYNPVALATVYGPQVPAWVAEHSLRTPPAAGAADVPLPALTASSVPLVLVVDDSITVRRVTQRLLQREGYRVALAADGLQALERLAQERPAVVLSDIEMPRMDGFDLVRNIRNDVRLSQLPVIMITSRIAEKHRDLARELGVDHYLGKPYSEDELLALIARYARVAAEA